LWGFNSESKPTIFAISFSNTYDVGISFEPKYQFEADSIWAIRDGKRPLSTPICGFDDICPPSPIFYILITVGAVFVFVSTITLLLILIYVSKKQERKRLNMLWNIDFSKLIKKDQMVYLEYLDVISYF
jgi:hypothetical protein